MNFNTRWIKNLENRKPLKVMLLAFNIWEASAGRLVFTPLHTCSQYSGRQPPSRHGAGVIYPAPRSFRCSEILMAASLGERLPVPSKRFVKIKRKLSSHYDPARKNMGGKLSNSSSSRFTAWLVSVTAQRRGHTEPELSQRKTVRFKGLPHQTSKDEGTYKSSWFDCYHLKLPWPG